MRPRYASVAPQMKKAGRIAPPARVDRFVGRLQPSPSPSPLASAPAAERESAAELRLYLMYFHPSAVTISSDPRTSSPNPGTLGTG